MEFRFNKYPSRQKPDPVRPVYRQLVYYSSINYMHDSRYKDLLCLRTNHKVHPNKFNPQASEQSRAKKYHESAPRELISADSTDRFHKVTETTENRLDRISQLYYSTPQLWWIIAEANPSIMFDPMNVPMDTVLRIPQISRMYSGGVL